MERHRSATSAILAQAWPLLVGQLAVMAYAVIGFYLWTLGPAARGPVRLGPSRSGR